MSKLKKLLVGFLALVLTITMLPVQATVTAYADTTTTTSTIDTTKKGSLTIHKYEYNGDKTPTGTGSASDEVPEGATVLEGVTFKVTLVYALTDYYTVEGKKLPTVDDAYEVLKDENVTSEEYNNFSHIGSYAEVTTNSEGKAEVKSMPLGIYLVQETAAPAQITGKTADFLVSIPMTNSISQNPEDSPASSNQWIYDVHVYPKNSSTYGEVTLLKQGKVGTGDPSPLSGATFVLQKKVDGTWTNVTENTKGESITLTTNNGGTISASDLAPGDYRFIETDVSDNSYIMDGATGYEFTIAAEAGTDGADHDYSAGSVLIGGNYSSDPITVTNYKPEVDKDVLEKGTTDNWGNAADYSVGDRVEFKVTADVPANINLLNHYVLEDKMSSGLADADNIDIKYYCEGTEVTGTDLLTTITGTESGWKLDLSDEVNRGLLYANKVDKIVVTFDAELTAEAVTAGLGNPNDVYLEYTNKILPSTDSDPQNPNTPGDADPSEETLTITDRVVVYTFGIQLVKTFTGGETSELSATFDLYRVATEDDGDSLVETIKYENNDIDVVKVGTYTTDENGDITINTEKTATDNDKAFSVGDYYFVETKTANGYNLLKSPVKATITITYDPTITTTTITTKYDAAGNKTSEAVGTLTTTDSNYSSGVLKGEDNTIAVITSVTNSKGFELPTTGGMGTVIFVIVGGSMMLAAVLLLLMSKKKEAK